MPTVLLCHCDGTNGSTTFTDTWGGRTLTATNATVTTTSPKFGTGCVDFTAGSTPVIQATTGLTDFNFGSGQFTVECWAWQIGSVNSGTHTMVGQWLDPSNDGWIFCYTSSGQLCFAYTTNGTTFVSVNSFDRGITGAWEHLAVDRDASNVLRIYAGGSVRTSSTVAATIFPSTANLSFGNDMGRISTYPGKIDEVRITKGTALYAGAFTVPSAPFADPAGGGGTQARAMVLA